MRSTTLFGIYAAVITCLVVGLAWQSLYSLEKSRWWDARTQLAQEAYGLHLKLQVNIYRLFKQKGDAFLIGDTDNGATQAALQADIAKNLADIRNAIAREIQMAGEEEIEELEALESIEADIRTLNNAISIFTPSSESFDETRQIEQMASLLGRQIDVELDRKIQAALDEEQEEVEEVLAEAVAFRASNERLTYVMVAVALATLCVGVISFNRQIHKPIVRLKEGIDRLRKADYDTPVILGGSVEFQDLGTIITRMSDNLARREASREEQRRGLEEAVAARTSEQQGLINRLEQAENNRKQLMADISHELRTPLTTILGEAEVTLRTAGELDTDISDVLARIRDAARHTNQIVDDMLTVARQEAGQLRLDRQEIDLRKIVMEAIAIFPMNVKTNFPDAKVLGYVDEVRMRQTVLALLQNARRYGGPNISASVSSSADAKFVVIEDDGPGLGASEKTQAFVRFYRGSNASSRNVEGSGLGLPVVKSIVEAHGGSVELLDRAGGGLSVRVTIPSEPRMTLVHSEKKLKSA